MELIGKVLVPCDVEESGLFPDEVTVKVRNTDGSLTTFPADRYLVFDRENRHFVRVTRLGVDERGVSVCVIPAEDSYEGGRWIRVPTVEVRAA